MFSTRLENFLLFSSNLKLSSVKCFNLDQSKILSSGNGLILIFSSAVSKKTAGYCYSLGVIVCRRRCAKTVTLCRISALTEHLYLKLGIKLCSLSKEQPMLSREITVTVFLSELCTFS